MPVIAAPFNIPPTWTNAKIRLYHGTLAIHVPSILAGINPAAGRPGTDFGIGFYTTTSETQAKSWAFQMATAALAGGTPGAKGCVLVFEVDRDDLSRLDNLVFVRSDRDAEDYWSFVFHCRNLGTGHGRGIPVHGYYDVVCGPVTAFWYQLVAMPDSDQISFHTSAAAALLQYQRTIHL